MNKEFPLIVVPRWLTRPFIRSKIHELSFVYSDAYHNNSYLGQCSAAKGSVNCYVVYTLWKPCSNQPPSNFFRDEEFEEFTKDIIDSCIKRIPKKLPVILFPKIGEGRSRLKERAPRTYNYLMEELQKIEYPNYRRTL